jgi:two-component system phosphate regulon response regulator PhoB
VEDELAIQELLQVNLQHAGHEVLCVGDAESASASIRSTLPDLVLLDWMLPDTPGIVLARRLRQEPRTRDVSIILLTGRAQEQDKIAGLEAGADDYVTKPFSPREVIARIQAVLRRRAPQLTDDAVELGGLRLEATTRRVFANNLPLEVGATEFRLLHFFMTHPERVHTRAQVLDQVWGDHVFVEERTVDVHIRRLRKSLQSSGHHQMIETVRGSGYRFASAIAG